MPEPFEITHAAGIQLQFSSVGHLQAIRHDSVLINQVIPLAIEDGLMRLAVRKKGSSRQVVPLTGWTACITQREITANSVMWKGKTEQLEHTTHVLLHAQRSAWFWRVHLRNTGETAIPLDVIYGQDLGLAHVNAVTNNEAYVSHYVDHLPLETKSLGPIILSRQNQAQSGNRFPWIAQGCLEGAALYGTDGSQFFGKDHRVTGAPTAWSTDLPSQRAQYEFAYISLQSRDFQLEPGEERTITFFAYYEPDHPKASSEEDIQAVLDRISSAPPAPAPHPRALDFATGASVFSTVPPLTGEMLSQSESRGFFPGPWRHVEERNGELHSFFHGESRHAITRAKEALVERPHGHLLRSGEALWPEENILGTTVYAAGIFNAQVFLGNTNLARFLSVVRNALNVTRASGQRVFVKIDGDWRQLGVPSAFDMGPRDARWIYRLGDLVIEAQTWCWTERPAATLELHVRGGRPLEFLVTHHLALGDNEQAVQGKIELAPGTGAVSCLPPTESLMHQHMPGVGLALVVDSPESVARLGGAELLGGNELGPVPLVVVQTTAVSQCSITLTPHRANAQSLVDLAQDIRASLPMAKPVSNSLRLPLADLTLEHPSDAGVARLSEAVPWFAHNAAIHLATPHGLEQYGGAAWGVRDVCQGPVEWLLAAGRHAEVRRILLHVFAQQHGDDGSWPQWYMHPPFAFIRQEDAHGDIPFWPLKALCDYVESSNDFTILRERVAYRARSSEARSRPEESVLEHVDRIIEHYRDRCLAPTALINYGDGDWDDTLQPADPSLRSTMVSSWTVGLVYHSFRLWREVCVRSDNPGRANALTPILEQMENGFRQLLIIDGQTCGFALQEGATFRLLLHPKDTLTGIPHRLLPMTRAILAELFTRDQARHHAELIRQHLLFPDGVRLMSSPVPYRGGVETIFKRAESAANFGREIGLQYVHAHLRYAEAMAKLGDGDALWRALQVVNPVRLDAFLAHAAPRQSNAYFSSSDGEFANRYQAASNFDRLRDGTVAVKGGWRIYSSGPGLYLHKVFTCLLGWRESFGTIVLDPVLPASLDGLTVQFHRAGKTITAHYRVRGGSHTPKAITINDRPIPPFKPLPGAYRTGGVAMSLADFDAALDRSHNRIQIDM